jgi:hypothetical protein
MVMKRILVIAALLACACGKDNKSASEMVKAWKKAGLQPSEFSAAETKLGGKCQAGTVDQIDTILCEFKDDAAAKQAQDKGLEIVGETTGASLARGRMVLVVADRKNADPNGKKIQEITKTFRQ